MLCCLLWSKVFRKSSPMTQASLVSNVDGFDIIAEDMLSGCLQNSQRWSFSKVLITGRLRFSGWRSVLQPDEWFPESQSTRPQSVAVVSVETSERSSLLTQKRHNGIQVNIKKKGKSGTFPMSVHISSTWPVLKVPVNICSSQCAVSHSFQSERFEPIIYTTLHSGRWFCGLFVMYIYIYMGGGIESEKYFSSHPYRQTKQNTTLNRTLPLQFQMLPNKYV